MHTPRLKGIFIICISIMLASCVGKKKFTELNAQYGENKTALKETQIELDRCLGKVNSLENQLKQREGEISGLEDKSQILQEELDFQKKNNTNLLDRMSDLSILSKTEALNLQTTLESLGKQDAYIKDLTSSIREKDSINLALVMNLKRSLSDINDEDVQIEVKKGVVYVSISDKLLFTSGSAKLSKQAEVVLGKVAKVVNDHKDIDIMVEGHTDNVPISNACMEDNWDLSVKRATSVVRYLQTKQNVAASRMSAAGRGEFQPKSVNDSSTGRQANRRTEIIITPKLDQFFNLLQTPEGK